MSCVGSLSSARTASARGQQEQGFTDALLTMESCGSGTYTAVIDADDDLLLAIARFPPAARAAKKVPSSATATGPSHQMVALTEGPAAVAVTCASTGTVTCAGTGTKESGGGDEESCMGQRGSKRKSENEPPMSATSASEGKRRASLPDHDVVRTCGSSADPRPDACLEDGECACTRMDSREGEGVGGDCLCTRCRKRKRRLESE